MSRYNFKEINIVPPANQFIDIILSRTQRKTPTVVHKRFKIARIRKFYMRKIKFTQSNIHERLSHILTHFPRIDDIHPFYADLIHVLYDKDHYKLALGQLNTAKNLVDHIAKDYIKLLKYGDSLYRCKQLKRAALGRMCTLIKKQDVSLKYLEQVRQHLSRLPSIDPNTRTLILTGYPNVGKSSFINKISRAKVDVQPYAFTTKSLFVGHTDYKYLRWQVIDTPGILDHPLQVLDECNNIEMQAITALAHIHSCVLFFIDLSPLCEHSIAKQIHLYRFLEPIFAQKPILFIASKCDLRRLEELDSEDVELIRSLCSEKNTSLIELSNATDEGVIKVKNTACDLLLDHRIENKLRGKKADSIADRIQVVRPVKRDNKVRPPTIPKGVILKKQNKIMEDETDIKSKPCEKPCLRDHWKLKNAEWKFDCVPEIINGQNIVDWIDPDIEKRLEELEKEEARLEAEEEQRTAMEPDSEDDYLNEDEQELYDVISKKRDEVIAEARVRRNQNKPGFYRKTTKRTIGEMEERLNEIGLDTSKLADRAQNPRRSRSRKRARTETSEVNTTKVRSVSKSIVQALKVKSVRQTGIKDTQEKIKAIKLARKSEFKRNKMARSGPGDRRIFDSKPKHLFSGKRGIGKTDRR